MQYAAHSSVSFELAASIILDINYGWWLRVSHANGASLYFIIIYAHVGRGLYFGSPRITSTWLRGVSILLITMAVAFLGYVLPWGQISFWGATVITNLISSIPYVGTGIVYWLWGGFAIRGYTLTRFFTLHFVMPLGLIVVLLGHLFTLHERGSRNPFGLNSDLDKIPFHPYYTTKDIVGWVVAGVSLFIVVLCAPWYLGDAENFIEANNIVTPIHIKPEWYFLFAYAILRSVPRKLGGVVALGLSVLVLIMLPVVAGPLKHVSPVSKTLFWVFIGVFIILTWVGGKPVERPFIVISQGSSILYFVAIVVQGWV